MIFAELAYSSTYDEAHAELDAVLRRHFPEVMSGHQGDSWIWILDGDEKVEVDSFTSMKHQIKSSRAGALVQKVIEVLAVQYPLRVYPAPEREAHEDLLGPQG